MKQKKLFLLFLIVTSFMSCSQKYISPGIYEKSDDRYRMNIQFYSDSCFKKSTVFFCENEKYIDSLSYKFHGAITLRTCDSTSAFGKYKIDKNQIIFTPLLKCSNFNSFKIVESYLPENDSNKTVTFEMKNLNSDICKENSWFFEFNNDTSSLCLFDNSVMYYFYDSLWYQKHNFMIKNFVIYFMGLRAEYTCKDSNSNHFELFVPDLYYWDFGFPSSAERWYVLNENMIISDFKERDKRYRKWQVWLLSLKKKGVIKLRRKD